MKCRMKTGPHLLNKFFLVPHSALNVKSEPNCFRKILAEFLQLLLFSFPFLHLITDATLTFLVTAFHKTCVFKISFQVEGH